MEEITREKGYVHSQTIVEVNIISTNGIQKQDAQGNTIRKRLMSYKLNVISLVGSSKIIIIFV